MTRTGSAHMRPRERRFGVRPLIDRCVSSLHVSIHRAHAGAASSAPAEAIASSSTPSAVLGSPRERKLVVADRTSAVVVHIHEHRHELRLLKLGRLAIDRPHHDLDELVQGHLSIAVGVCERSKERGGAQASNVEGKRAQATRHTQRRTGARSVRVHPRKRRSGKRKSERRGCCTLLARY